MKVAVRLAAFALAVVAAFGVGFGLGELAGPFSSSEPHSVHDK